VMKETSVRIGDYGIKTATLNIHNMSLISNEK
jgi:hypothetical protein